MTQSVASGNGCAMTHPEVSGKRRTIMTQVRLKRACALRLQKRLYNGPTPRKDAEEMERARWIEALSTLLRATQTPMGKMLIDKPQTAQLLGAGRRVTTLRLRVRKLHSRLTSSCTRGTLKNTHRSFTFLEEGGSAENRVRHRKPLVPGAVPRAPQQSSTRQTNETSTSHAGSHVQVD